jgi:hypothetical protein
MSNQPRISLKAVANDLAAAFTSEDGDKILRFLRLTGVLDARSPTSKGAGQEGAVRPAARRVGIWKPEGGSYVRDDATSAEWGLWAAVHTIWPKGRMKRVVLVGESAARGFLYDPKFNPAKALTAYLAEILGPKEVEVVDLAKTGIGLAELRRVALSAIDLQPDGLVIFAGNNWGAIPADLSTAERYGSALTLRENGLAGLRALAEKKLRDATSELIDEVAARASEHSVPVVVVVPEYNLADWRDVESSPPWLEGVALHAWWECHDRLAEAMAAKNYAAAAVLAEQLTALDKGTAKAGLYALAECRREMGRIDQARSLLEQARDADTWDPASNLVPKAPLAVQDSLRAGAAKHGLALVDLPRVFEAHSAGGLPDRRLFLDYCHMAQEGILVSMRETAAVLLPLLGVAGDHRRRLEQVKVEVSDRDRAEAHFAAAMHNAHWGQEGPIVGFHCARAIAADPKVAKLMEPIIEMSARRAPGWMCRATEQLAAASNMSLIRFVLALLPREPKLMDLLLQREIGHVLGSELERKVDALRTQEYGRPQTVTHLELPYFSLSSIIQREAQWSNRRADSPNCPDYYRAYRRHSAFSLIENGAREVRFALTFRVPGGNGQQRLQVEVNGQRVLDADAGAPWSTCRFSVGGDNVRRGVNEVVVRWPAPTIEGSDGIKRAAESIEHGMVPDFYPVYGEIHSFTAASVGNVAAG